jgi:hypothetical protein
MRLTQKRPPETQIGEVQPLAEIKHTVIDFQTARENRQVKESVINEPAKTPEYKTDEINHAKDAEKEDSNTESDQLTQGKEQLQAMGIIGTKLVQFEVPEQKREEIFENLADDPKAILKVAGVIKNFQPQNSIEILENIAAFRKRIDEAVQNGAARELEEAKQELSGFELLCLILGAFLKGAVGDEFEQIG